MELVRVYRNLHRSCYSVQSKINGRWVVTEYVTQINLIDAHFKVSRSGRERVLSERRKNVHAVIQGLKTERDVTVFGLRVKYDPYENGYFAYADGTPVHYSPTARLDEGGITV